MLWPRMSVMARTTRSQSDSNLCCYCQVQNNIADGVSAKILTVQLKLAQIRQGEHRLHSSRRLAPRTVAEMRCKTCCTVSVLDLT